MPQEWSLSLSWMNGLFLGLLTISVAKDSLLLLMVSVEIVTALVISYSCILGPSSVLLVGGVLVCGSSVMLAGLIMSL